MSNAPEVGTKRAACGTRRITFSLFLKWTRLESEWVNSPIEQSPPDLLDSGVGNRRAGRTRTVHCIHTRLFFRICLFRARRRAGGIRIDVVLDKCGCLSNLRRRFVGPRGHSIPAQIE